MRLLIAIPHYFGPGPANSPNQSNRPEARRHRLQALGAVITSLHQHFGADTFGLDHDNRWMVRAKPPAPHALDIVVCTTGTQHLIDELKPLKPLFRHHETAAQPPLLGFECHRLLRDHPDEYDYYGYVEDDVVMTDPGFFRKRRVFDRRFGPAALLQPNRYEAAATGPARKLYVDYRLARRVTGAWQNLDEAPRLTLRWCDDRIRFERASYPSSGCFFLDRQQLQHWTGGPHFLDGDLSYMDPLDSASILSVMKSFRVYKPILDHAWFLEVLHASPRWIGGMNLSLAKAVAAKRSAAEPSPERRRSKSKT